MALLFTFTSEPLPEHTVAGRSFVQLGREQTVQNIDITGFFEGLQQDVQQLQHLMLGAEIRHFD